jgi:hypothetical protein
MLAILFSVTACQEYDLHRPDKIPTGGDDTATEPEEDPDISVSPSVVDFGSVAKDCPAPPIEVTITNEGLADLVVSDIALAGSGSSAFGTMGAGTEFTLAHGETRSFDVEFTPNAYVDYSLDLEISSNDPDEALTAVPTSGAGAEDSIFEEGFVQTYNELVDVLWVVDNSCSMEEELDQVRNNFTSFVTEFTSLGLDYHLAVVTTDMDNPDHKGKIQGEIIDSSTADPIATFLDATDLGFDGSPYEKGFAAAQAALTAPLTSGANAGFLRESAALAIIVLSDETDGSGMSASNFSSWLGGLKSDPALANFSAICGDRGFGCQEFDWAGNTLSASGGDKYIDATELTGGFWASICTSDYTEIMQHISLASAGMTVSFALSREPSNLTDVAVTVDSATIPNDYTDGWTYDSSFNAVVFHGTAIPGPNAVVNVSYPVAEECEG